MAKLTTFDDPTSRRIVSMLREWERTPPEIGNRNGRSVSPSAREVRWARTTTNYYYPTYPTSGPTYVVEFGDYVPNPDPPYPNATVTNTFTAYDPAWQDVAVDPSNGTLIANGTVVRVERHEGRWWIRPIVSSTTLPSVYLSDFTRILASGSGSPASNEISKARAGAIYFQQAWGSPSDASVEVLTGSANDSDDPSIKILSDGCYRLAVGFSGDDTTVFNVEDYYTTYSTSTASSHNHTYKFFDVWHHAKALLYVCKRASGGSWDGSWIMYGASNREVFGGFGSYLGGGSTALSGGSWSYGTMRCFGMERFNFDENDEIIFRLFYNDYSPISDTALTFEIVNFNVEITRLGDQVTPTTYALP